jgi:hypothetical protein
MSKLAVVSRSKLLGIWRKSAQYDHVKIWTVPFIVHHIVNNIGL